MADLHVNPGFLQRRARRFLHRAQIEWLDHEIGGTMLQHVYRSLDILKAGNRDNWNIGEVFLHVSN
ncbi:MAG: hypothetical protein LC642_08345 [Verrucomicrobiaceae bacterium]|nr:hypothetical protein [Verrucomicrobiaceae bacterium]